METSTQKTSLERVEAAINELIFKPEEGIDQLVEVAFQELKSNSDNTREILAIVGQKLGMGFMAEFADKLSKKLNQSAGEATERMVVQRGIQLSQEIVMKG